MLLLLIIAFVDYQKHYERLFLISSDFTLNDFTKIYFNYKIIFYMNILETYKIGSNVQCYNLIKITNLLNLKYILSNLFFKL